MRNIDLIECAMRRLNLQYDVPFKLGSVTTNG